MFAGAVTLALAVWLFWLAAPLPHIPHYTPQRIEKKQ